MSVTASYDGYARLTAYSQGATSLTHVYNGLDDRVSTTTGGSTTRFSYDPDSRIIGEYGTTKSFGAAIIQQQDRERCGSPLPTPVRIAPSSVARTRDQVRL